MLYNFLMERLQVVKEAADPAELGLTRADIATNNLDLVSTEEEHLALSELVAASDVFGFSNQCYLVEASRSFILPADCPENEPVIYQDFQEGVAFRGILHTYGVVKINRLEVADCWVRSLCMVFCDFFCLANLEVATEEDKRLLCTPVYAVEDIEMVEMGDQ